VPSFFPSQQYILLPLMPKRHVVSHRYDTNNVSVNCTHSIVGPGGQATRKTSRIVSNTKSIVTPVLVLPDPVLKLPETLEGVVEEEWVDEEDNVPREPSRVSSDSVFARDPG